MEELLNQDEIRTFYNNLLTKPGYMNILKDSISKTKIEQIFSYAERVNKEACHQLDNDVKDYIALNLYLKKILNFEFPPFPDEQTKHLNYKDFEYKDRLNYWFETSYKIIQIIEHSMQPVPQRNLHEVDASGLKTFKTPYTLEQLDIIRTKLIDAKIIKSISVEDFRYLFTEQAIFKAMERLRWKESAPLGHEFLKRAVYNSSNFNFNQVNACMIFPKDHKLDSNDKSTAQYKNDDKLNPILSF